MTTSLHEAYFKNMTGSTPTLQRMGTLVQCEINSANFFFSIGLNHITIQVLLTFLRANLPKKV